MPRTEDSLQPAPEDEALREIELFLTTLEGPPQVSPPAAVSPSGGSTWVQQAEPMRLDGKY